MATTTIQLVAAMTTLALAIAFDYYCLNDLTHADVVLYLPPVAWAAIICVATPFGGIAYLILGRVR
jgi:hypothetical protein